jgi:pimeloyl-ACP methyl ester carboxylesterase
MVTGVQTCALPIFTIQIFRPPVFLIHGIWGAADGWNYFSAVVSDLSQRFDVYAANYKNSNASSVSFNEPLVFDQLGQALSLFKSKHSAAAVQADVVVHSMGGLIARSMVLDPRFYSSASFDQGLVHKLITIDTPFAGSEFASRLELSSYNIICGAAFLYSGHDVAGAVHDMVPGSALLTKLNSATGRHLLHVHSIVGNASQSQMDANLTAIRWKLTLPCPLLMPSGGFQAVFNDDSDLVVSEASQQFGVASWAVDVSNGTIHAVNSVLFPNGPDSLDTDYNNGTIGPAAVLTNSPKVVQLLNTFISDTKFVAIGP